MVTRKQIREFRFWKKELQALRAMIRQAELDARTGGGRSGDERRARERAARYERMAEAVAKEQARIEAVRTARKYRIVAQLPNVCVKKRRGRQSLSGV